MIRRLTALILMLLMAAVSALAEETTGAAESYRECLESYRFEAPVFESAVLYEDTTGEPFDLTISVKSVEEDRMVIEVDNRCEGPVNITFAQYMVDDNAIYQYNDWTVAARTARAFELDIPLDMLKWAGRRTVSAVSLYSVEITGKGSVNGIQSVDLVTAQLTETPSEPVWQGEGYVLYDEEWGSLTLLGIDYNDRDPRVFFRAENRQPNWKKDWLPLVTYYAGVEAWVKITSVNGVAVDEGAHMLITGMNTAIDEAYLDGFPITGLSGEPRRAQIGYVEEMTMTVSVQAGGGNGVFEDSRELTIRPKDIGVISIGNPYDDWENRCFGMTYDDFPDEWKAYYQRQMDAQ